MHAVQHKPDPSFTLRSFFTFHFSLLHSSAVHCSLPMCSKSHWRKIPPFSVCNRVSPFNIPVFYFGANFPKEKAADQSALFWMSAPVAQMDRANASEALGREFESLRAHHQHLSNQAGPESPLVDDAALALPLNLAGLDASGCNPHRPPRPGNE